MFGPALMRRLRAALLAPLMAALSIAPAGAQAPAACFAAPGLAGTAREKTPVHGAPGSKLAPPATPVARAPAANVAGSIRRVDLPVGEKFVALTFDLCEASGEVAGYDGALVDFLRANKVPATLFAGGKWLLTHPARANQLLADPQFEIGNHTWTHWNLGVASGAGMRAQVDAADAAYAATRASLSRVCPAAAAPASMGLFRFPYGSCSAESLGYVNQRGYRAIQWDVDSGDPWAAMNAGRMARGVLDRVRPGSIVLMHANGRGFHTAEALAEIVPALRARGFEFLTVSALLARGKPVVAATCYGDKPGDTEIYDKRWRALAGGAAR